MGERFSETEIKKFSEETRIQGITAGCYCCGKQFHLNFEDIDILPVVKIEGQSHYIMVCDNCEEDIDMLTKSGVSNISFDVLNTIQGDLNRQLDILLERSGKFSMKQRNKILIELYNSTFSELNCTFGKAYLKRALKSNKGK